MTISEHINCLHSGENYKFKLRHKKKPLNYERLLNIILMTSGAVVLHLLSSEHSEERNHHHVLVCCNHMANDIREEFLLASFRAYALLERAILGYLISMGVVLFFFWRNYY